MPLRKPKPQAHGGAQIRLYFRPLLTFEHEDDVIAHSCYVEGALYTIRPDNHHLNKLARKWEKEGKVRFVSDANQKQAGMATSSGKMETR